MSTAPRPVAKGWCPGAYRPMMSGDGLVVRVRPTLARLTAAQALGLCDLAQRFGSGVIDLTSRANLQVRGVAEPNHEPLLQALNALDLLPDDPALESRRNILVPFDWQEGDATHQIASELMTRLADLPPLPAKVGFAIDAGPAPLLSAASADFRIERAEDATLIARADGAEAGRPVTEATAAEALIETACWFVETGGAENRRMARHIENTALPEGWTTLQPAAKRVPAHPGQTAHGLLLGAAFGQIDARALRALLEDTNATGLRVTPWRTFLLEGVSEIVTSEAFITTGNDPLLTIDACPGAPLCESATVETRTLARALAGRADKPLHISGCSKGCAFPRAKALTLVGRDGAFDLVRDGLPWDRPVETGLTPQDLTQRIGDL